MIIFIDGPSGSGKTTIAKHLGKTLNLPVVHMDEFYPGWSGLAAGATIIAHDVLHATNPGYHRWDWKHNQAGDWVTLPKGGKIIEGVGAVTSDTVQAALRIEKHVLVIILSADAAVRRTRALRRDPSYEPYWHMWAAQEQVHFATLATLPTDAVPWTRIDGSGMHIQQVCTQLEAWIAAQTPTPNAPQDVPKTQEKLVESDT
ncbi:MAG: (d)CMP kinase [Corynebacterium sp.]|nr:(d)CMP kinase [Corynebacterium sp.]